MNSHEKLVQTISNNLVVGANCNESLQITSENEESGGNESHT